jgi:integrase
VQVCDCRNPETGKRYAYRKCPKLGTRGHGRWHWKIRVPREYVALVGKTFVQGDEATKKAAEDAVDAAIAQIRAGQQHIGALSTGTYLEQWLAGKRRLRPTTRRSYAGHIRLHLVPLIGAVPLAQLRAHHIATAYQRIEAAGAVKSRPTGPATIARIHATLRNALSAAVDQRLIPFDPTTGVELPEYSRPEVEPWEATEVGAFLDEAAGDRLSAMWELIALHGVRRGEACGATWPGLDHAASVLTITQQITESGGRHGVWAPKTRSGRRKVDLNATLLGSLLAHRIAQDSEREDVGADRWDNGALPDEHGRPVQLEGLIFTRPDGRYLAPETVSQRMQVIARRAGLLATVRVSAQSGARTLVVGMLQSGRGPLGTWTLHRDRGPIGKVTVTAVTRLPGNRTRLGLAGPLDADVEVGVELGRGLLSRRRLHDLRHASASIQLQEGVGLEIVSKRLGHSSSAITSALYAHLLRPAGQAAAEKVAAAVPRSAPRSRPVPAGGEHGEPLAGR